MALKISRQRTYAGLIILGVSILLFRTLRMMLVEHALEVLMLWVILLLILEFLTDLSCLLSALVWFLSNSNRNAMMTLRLGAAATLLHALRVLIYALGRIGPWVNFDVRPEYRAIYVFDWSWVYFASVLSGLSIVAIVVIWRIGLYRKKHRTGV